MPDYPEYWRKDLQKIFDMAQDVPLTLSNGFYKPFQGDAVKQKSS